MQNWFYKIGGTASCFLMFLAYTPALAQETDDLRERLEKMEREIQNLKRQIEDADAKAEAAKTRERKTRTVSRTRGHDHSNEHDHGGGHGHAERHEHAEKHGYGEGHGHGGGHSHGKTDWSRMSIGGFGELHYGSSPINEVDFHRFVLAFGYRFNDWISLSTELSMEHALVGGHGSGGHGVEGHEDEEHEGEEHENGGGEEGGELELEQASVNFQLTDSWDLKAGGASDSGRPPEPNSRTGDFLWSRT